MWIRSQDKKKLVNCNSIMVVDGTITNEAQIWDDTRSECLGIYKNTDRAIKVLDEIHEKLVTCARYDSIIDGERIAGEAVYQMPQE